MKQAYLKSILIVPGIIALAMFTPSCKKNISPIQAGNTSVNVFLTDDQSLIFDAVFIDIAKLEVKTEDSSNEQENENEHGNGEDGHNGNNNDNHSGGGWITLNINPGVYNLLNFRNGLDTILASGSIPSPGVIQKIRVTLGFNNSVVLNGSSFPLQVKDNNNTVVINLNDDDISTAQNGSLHFWLDFDAGRSVRQHGNVFELRSNIKAFSKEKAGSIEGKVLPLAAKPIVYVIKGTDTSSGKPGREGEFKFVGLKAGTYSLLIDATAGNYKDTIIQNITVRNNEDAHVGAVTLRQ